MSLFKKIFLSFGFLALLTPLYSLSQYNKDARDIHEHFITDFLNLDKIEGVWKCEYVLAGIIFDNAGNPPQSIPDFASDLKLAIIKSGNHYKALSYDEISGVKSSLNGFFESLEFSKTASGNIYSFELSENNLLNEGNAVFNSSSQFEFSYNNVKAMGGGVYNKDITTYKFLKISPNEDEVKDLIEKHKREEAKAKEDAPSSGTGFALTSTGLIITNYHVIKNGNTYKVRGIGGNFDNSISATLEATDIENDLALLKLSYVPQNSISQIPYVIRSSQSEAGENIFVLGYPLRATMGEEIKLTNGIISAKTGFQGAINSYQISAPAQPGNSGGPLFDMNGNLIGVVNSKNTEAENANYAIKSKNVIALFNYLQTSQKLNTINLLKGKSLTAQLKQIKKFVYIIESSK